MATIVTQTQTADNADHIQDAFRRQGRDCYPLGVYKAIFNLINETHNADAVCELDVIAWCCDLRETTIGDPADLEGLTEHDVLDLLDALVDRLWDETTVLYVDYDTATVYHLTYHLAYHLTY